MKKKIFVIFGLILGLSIISLSTLQKTSSIDDKTIIITDNNLKVFYFNNLDPENPYNKDFKSLTSDQINQLKKDYIQREVLTREAKNLGLDKMDSIISARLAQLGQQALVGFDLNTDDVDIEVLNNYFTKNKSLYIEPETISFSHVFFPSYELAESFLIDMKSETDEGKIDDLIKSGGIVFPYQKNYSKKTYSFILGHFGEKGTSNIFSLDKETKEWQGPIQSSLGYHLIRIFNYTKSKQLDLNQVLTIVRRDYFEDLRKSETNTIINNKVNEYNISDRINN